MSLDKKLARQKLTALWRDSKIPVLPIKRKKYVIISDVHLGDGGRADDLRRNEDALVRALDHYKRKKYSLILIGDIEEFWQFDLERIVGRYNDTVYRKMRAFGDEHIYRVYGNHDSEWGCPPDPARKTQQVCGTATAALKLKDSHGKACVMLVHGHQGSKESDKTSWFSRFWVRIYRNVEPFFKIDRHPSATKSQVKKDYERILYSWAKDTKVILICGHSHRAIFASLSYADRLQDKIGQIQAEILKHPGDRRLFKRNRKKLEKLFKELLSERQRNRDVKPVEGRRKPLPCYFNTGCALYTDGITAIEVDDDTIKLAKWHRKARNGSYHEIFEDCEGSLSSFVEQVTRKD